MCLNVGSYGASETHHLLCSILLLIISLFSYVKPKAICLPSHTVFLDLLSKQHIISLFLFEKAQYDTYFISGTQQFLT